MKKLILNLIIKKAPASAWAQALSEVYESISVDDLILFLEKAPEGVLEFFVFELDDNTEILLSNKKCATYIFLTQSKVSKELEYLYEDEDFITTDELLQLTLELLKEKHMDIDMINKIYDEKIIIREENIKNIKVVAELVRLGFDIERIYYEGYVSDEFLISLIEQELTLVSEPRFPLSKEIIEHLIKKFDNRFLMEVVENNINHNNYWEPDYSVKLYNTGFPYSELSIKSKITFMMHLFEKIKKDEFKIQSNFEESEIGALISNIVADKNVFETLIRYVVYSEVDKNYTEAIYSQLDVTSKNHVEAVNYVCEQELLRKSFYDLFTQKSEWLQKIELNILKRMFESKTINEELKQKVAEVFLDRVVSGKDAVEKVQKLLKFVDEEISEAKKYLY